MSDSPFLEPGSDPLPHIQGDDTFGAVLMGTAIALIVQVFSLFQAFQYFKLYRTDTRFLRGLVCTALVLDLVHTVLAINGCYWHLVVNHANVDSLFRNYWSFQSFNLASVVVMLVCQLFYARRMHRALGPGYLWVTLVVVVGMVSTIVLAIVLTVQSARLADLIVVEKINWTLAWMYGSAMITDITLTSALVIKLLKSRSGWKQSDTVIKSIVTYTISSGLLFTVIAAVCFIFAIIEYGNLIYVGISNVAAKVYVFSMITAIKSRKSFSMRMMMSDTTLAATFATSQTRASRSQVRRSAYMSPIVFNPPILASASTRTLNVTQTSRSEEDS